MTNKIPNTPFATRLSGSAKETQLRLRSIFQWKKQRPPVWLFAFIVVVIFGCMGLISCQQEEAVSLPSLTLSDGKYIYAKVQEPESAEAAMDDVVTALYCKTTDDSETCIGQIPFGPEHPYWDSVSLKEFQDVLGYDGVVIGYSSSSASYAYDYCALATDWAELIATARNTVYELDVDRDGQKELITNYGTNHYLDVFQVVDGRIECCQLNELVREDLALDEYTWVELYYYEETELVTAAWAKPNGEKMNRPLPIGSLFSLAKNHIQYGTISEVRTQQASLRGLTLDDVGEGDDSVYMTAYLPSDYSAPCKVDLRAILSGAKEVTYTWDLRAYPELQSGKLTRPDRDSILVALADTGSTYGATSYYVLDLVDGQFVERLEFNGISGSYIRDQGAAPLDSLRLAQLVDKWHSQEFYTAIWNGEEFIIEEDGYFTDTVRLDGSYYDADNEPMELNLSLRGIDEDNGLIYDRVQIMKGGTVLQTMDPAPYLPERYYDYSGFLAYGATTYGAVDVRDINFDGYPDFGLLCDYTRNERHAWFVWNTEEHKFTYFAHLGGELEIVDTVWQLRETVRDENSGAKVTNHYSVSYTGKLVPLKAPAQEEDPSLAEATAAFQAVLGQKQPVRDATDGGRERKTGYTRNDITFEPIYFSVVDLDGDHVPEVVLWMSIGENTYAGFDILRYEDGSVVSYSQVYRGLQGLKEDGTFSFSSGAFDHGFGSVKALDENGVQIEDITWCQSAGNGTECFVDGRPASTERFNSALARQDEKPDVVWYEASGEQVNALGLLMAAAAG